jgi:hypothetical protein
MASETTKYALSVSLTVTIAGVTWFNQQKKISALPQAQRLYEAIDSGALKLSRWRASPDLRAELAAIVGISFKLFWVFVGLAFLSELLGLHFLAVAFGVTGLSTCRAYVSRALGGLDRTCYQGSLLRQLGIAAAHTRRAPAASKFVASCSPLPSRNSPRCWLRLSRLVVLALSGSTICSGLYLFLPTPASLQRGFSFTPAGTKIPVTSAARNFVWVLLDDQRTIGLGLPGPLRYRAAFRFPQWLSDRKLRQLFANLPEIRTLVSVHVPAPCASEKRRIAPIDVFDLVRHS